MNREELIAAMKATASQPPKKQEVAGWGTLYVKAMTVEQCDLQQQQPKAEGKDRFRFARACCRLICDESGVLLFDPDKQEDLELIAAQPWELLQQIINVGADEAATSAAGGEAVKKDSQSGGNS